MEDREKLKQEILEELKTEYRMIPIKESAFVVKDITDKYNDKICKKCKIHNDYNNVQSINNGIRKAVALHLGFGSIKDVKELEDRQKYRNELERFIKEYILQEEKQ